MPGSGGAAEGELVVLADVEDRGVLAPGARADLVLLRADPLADVANVRARVGVMVRGRWYPEAELQRRLARAREAARR